MSKIFKHSVIAGITLTPPVIGRVMIGHVELCEIRGKKVLLPKKDDFFTITTNVQNSDRTWEPHPVRSRLGSDEKLTVIPIVVAYNDLQLNVHNKFSAFDPQTGRLLCTGNGCAAKRITQEGVKAIDCPRPTACEFGRQARCRSMTRFYFRIDGQGNDLGVFVLRSTGYNSLDRLATQLGQLSGLSKGKIAGMQLNMVIRGKSTQQSMRTAIYHVDLEPRNDKTLIDTVIQARDYQKQLKENNLSLKGMENALLAGLANGDLGDEIEDTDEWIDSESDSDFLQAAVSSNERTGLRGLESLVRRAQEEEAVANAAMSTNAAPELQVPESLVRQANKEEAANAAVSTNAALELQGTESLLKHTKEEGVANAAVSTNAALEIQGPIPLVRPANKKKAAVSTNVKPGLQDSQPTVRQATTGKRRPQMW